MSAGQPVEMQMVLFCTVWSLLVEVLEGIVDQIVFEYSGVGLVIAFYVSA